MHRGAAPTEGTLRLPWGVAALQSRLDALWPGLALEVVASLGSSNTELLERARSRRRSDLAPCLLVAEEQTAGRGRLGRPWLSTPGHSLTFSLGLPWRSRHWEGLSLAVGVALAEALEPAAGGRGGVSKHHGRIALKWPNDLWLRDATAAGGGRKLGGILVETQGAGLGPADARPLVVGVGLNVALPAPAEGLRHAPAGLVELDSGHTAPAVLARAAPALLTALRRFADEGLAPFVAGFAARDLLRGQALDIDNPGNGAALHGVADGIDGRGALRLLTPGGCVAVSSGEASVRPARATAAG